MVWYLCIVAKLQFGRCRNFLMTNGNSKLKTLISLGKFTLGHSWWVGYSYTVTP